MSDEIGALKITIEASLKDFSARLGEVESGLQKTTSSVNQMGSKWQDTAKGMLLGGLGIASVAGAFETMKKVVIDSVKAYDDQFVAMKQLERLAGDEAPALESLAYQRSQATRYTKEEYQATEKSLLIHKLNADEIKKLMPVIENYAALSGASLTETANAFSYAIQFGSTRSLRQFGIELDKTGSQQQIFNDLVGLGAENSGNLAEEINTGLAAGANDAGKAMQEAAEAVGTFINEATPVARVLKLWAEGVLILSGADKQLALHMSEQRQDAQIALDNYNREHDAAVKKKTDLIEYMKALKKNKLAWTKSWDFFDIRNLKEAQEELTKINKQIVSIEATDPNKPKISKLSPPPRGKQEDPTKELAKEVELQLAKIEDSYDQNLISFADYIQEKHNLLGRQGLSDRDYTIQKLKLDKEERDGIKKIQEANEKAASASEKMHKHEIALSKEEKRAKLEIAIETAQRIGETFGVLYEATGKKITAFFYLQQSANLAAVIMDTMVAIMKGHSQLGVGGFWYDAVIYAKGAMAATKILTTPPPKAAEGGYLTGPSHTMGGVNVNMEGGEYIFDKFSTATLGVNNLASLHSAARSVSGIAAEGGAVTARSGMGVNIVNFVDSHLLDQYLSSSAGKNAIINVLQRNAFQVRKAVSIQ